MDRFGMDWPFDNLVTECATTILGGVVDPPNVLQYGLFRLCDDRALQERMYEEIRTVWVGGSREIPEIRLLKSLPLLVSRTARLWPCFALHAKFFSIAWTHSRKPSLHTWSHSWCSTHCTPRWCNPRRSASPTWDKRYNILSISTHEWRCIPEPRRVPALSMDRCHSRNDGIDLRFLQRQTAVPCKTVVDELVLHHLVHTTSRV